MPKFKVAMVATVTSWVTVEAEDADAALAAACEEGVPGLMHLNHEYPDVSEWEPATEGFTYEPWLLSEAVTEA